MTVKDLQTSALLGKCGMSPRDMFITGAAYIFQTTQFPGTTTKYYNHYLLTRVDRYFGACCHMAEQLDVSIGEELSGITLEQGICDLRLPVQIAAMDAYFGNIAPHRENCQEVLTLPRGSATMRAEYRDNAIAKLAKIEKGQKVALIGVVNPLVNAIREKGGICLPCDLEMKTTQWGDSVERDMNIVLEQADSVISTAMTLGNGTFDRIIETVKKRKIPLTIYGQTGSAVVAQFLNKGVTNLLAEPFPFSQFSAEESFLYVYKS